MNDTKTVRLSSDVHRLLKLAAVDAGLSMSDFLHRVILNHDPGQKEPDDLPDCPLCRKYGSVPNAETRKALKESRQGKGLSKPFKNTKELFDHLDHKG